MSCKCDIREHPKALDIPRGLTDLPREIGRFDDFRAGMWTSRADMVPLRDWSGQAPGDLGAMLVDFWAVVADVQAFYDRVRANEAYLRTAPTRDILTRLIARLGYRPRPATAASAWIAVEVAGMKSRLMPAGTAFRSGPVGDGPPQIFETSADVTVYPAFGKFDVSPPAPTTLAEAQGLATGVTDIASLWVEAGSLVAAVGDTIIAETDTSLYVSRLTATRKKTFGDEKTYTQIDLDPPLPVDPASLAPDALTLTRTSLTSRLWSASSVAGDPSKLSATSLVLNAPNGQFAPGDILTLTGSDQSVDVGRVATARETKMTLFAAFETTATDEDGEEFTIDTPAVFAPATRITFDRSLSVGGDAEDVIVSHGLSTAAELATPPSDGFPVTPNSTVPLAAGWRFRRRWPDRDPVAVTALLVDPFGHGGPVDAEIDPDTAEMTLGDDLDSMDLAVPVTTYGNAALVTRGETVLGEMLGTGDARIANQSFKLKKPLTYLPAPTEVGYASTLTLYVDGIEVPEVATLYGQPAEALVYMLREDEDGNTHATFGDGLRAARLASGAVVTADYRTGGGADRPEADSITQLVTPVDAVTATHQPFEAFGGSDPEDADMLVENAPRSAFLLGRAISLADFEAAALTQNGVLAAKSDWAWSDRRQRPVARVWYAGEPEVAADLSARLRALSDPSTSIEVLQATPVPLRLSLQVITADGYRDDDVLRALRIALTEPRHARFAFAQPRIGAPLFRSPIVAEALDVPGVRSLDGVNIASGPVPAEGKAAAQGTWFTVDPELGGALVLNGWEEGP